MESLKHEEQDMPRAVDGGDVRNVTPMKPPAPVMAIGTGKQRLSDRLVHIAREQDDKSPYPAAWRIEHGFAHGAELKTMNKSQYDVLVERNQQWEAMNEQLVTLADWLRVNMMQERVDGKWPFDGVDADKLNVAQVVLKVLTVYHRNQATLKEWLENSKTDSQFTSPPSILSRLISWVRG
jgi:hypothetical protein